jgi:hypothetical protein
MLKSKLELEKEIIGCRHIKRKSYDRVEVVKFLKK